LSIEGAGGTRVPLRGTSALGAELASGFDRGGLHVRGYRGTDKYAHCAHADMLGDAVRDYLEPAWSLGGDAVGASAGKR